MQERNLCQKSTPLNVLVAQVNSTVSSTTARAVARAEATAALKKVHL